MAVPSRVRHPLPPDGFRFLRTQSYRRLRKCSVYPSTRVRAFGEFEIRTEQIDRHERDPAWIADAELDRPGSSKEAALRTIHKYGNMGPMKTTLEVPDAVFRKAKATAAERGQSLGAFVTEALREKLVKPAGRSAYVGPPWMRGFGKLRRLTRETARIQNRIDREFEAVEPEDRE
jgi:hypothetical protein